VGPASSPSAGPRAAIRLAVLVRRSSRAALREDDERSCLELGKYGASLVPGHAGGLGEWLTPSMADRGLKHTAFANLATSMPFKTAPAERRQRCGLRRNWVAGIDWAIAGVGGPPVLWRPKPPGEEETPYLRCICVWKPAPGGRPLGRRRVLARLLGRTVRGGNAAVGPPPIRAAVLEKRLRWPG